MNETLSATKQDTQGFNGKAANEVKRLLEMVGIDHDNDVINGH